MRSQFPPQNPARTSQSWQGLGMSSRTAFEELYRETLHRVYALAHRYARALDYPDMVEDKVQEAYLRLLRQWERNGPPTYPVSWLYKTICHLMIDEMRRVSAQSRVLHSLHSEDLDYEPSPEALRLFEDTVRSVLSELPLKQREALALTYDGYGIKEIARLLDTSEVTVRSNLRHGRRRLAEALPDFEN
ncbi:RNA polymerase sigma factor [Herbidospora sp. RD11066]